MIGLWMINWDDKGQVGRIQRIGVFDKLLNLRPNQSTQRISWRISPKQYNAAMNLLNWLVSTDTKLLANPDGQADWGLEPFAVEQTFNALGLRCLQCRSSVWSHQKRLGGFTPRRNQKEDVALVIPWDYVRKIWWSRCLRFQASFGNNELIWPMSLGWLKPLIPLIRKCDRTWCCLVKRGKLLGAPLSQNDCWPSMGYVVTQPCLVLFPRRRLERQKKKDACLPPQAILEASKNMSLTISPYHVLHMQNIARHCKTSIDLSRFCRIISVFIWYMYKYVFIRFEFKVTSCGGRVVATLRCLDLERWMTGILKLDVLTLSRQVVRA